MYGWGGGGEEEGGYYEGGEEGADGAGEGQQQE